MERNTLGRKNGSLIAAGALGAALVGCASSAPTPELVDARRAYDRAEESAAADYRPKQLLAAREALDRAEIAHDDDPGSAREARLATTAENKANIAMTQGEYAEANRTAAVVRTEKQREERAEERAEERREERAENRTLAKSTAHERDRNDLAVAEVREERAAARADARQEGIDAREERKEKIAETSDDHGQARAALQSLAQVATVKEDSRGIVISMAGSLLFPTGKGELSPIARSNLDQVATALEAQDQSAQFAIEGHTDDSGSAALNEQLSEKRAKAVADYLNERGIAEGRMRVAGFGERMPVAANDTDEGRAANRRVDIVVSKGAGK
jgi:outer membrane protein OmpA-like peptidoglycan-associated protein